MVEHARGKRYPGYNASMGIGPAVLVPAEDTWKCTVKEKKAIYGKDNRVAPGGARQARARQWRIR
eukprot:4164934-Lingulodinium_polyedra.AAC.1